MASNEHEDDCGICLVPANPSSSGSDNRSSQESWGEFGSPVDNMQHPKEPALKDRGDGLYEMLLSLESRFSKVEKVIQTLHELLAKAVGSSMMQLGSNCVQREQSCQTVGLSDPEKFQELKLEQELQGEQHQATEVYCKQFIQDPEKNHDDGSRSMVQKTDNMQQLQDKQQQQRNGSRGFATENEIYYMDNGVLKGRNKEGKVKNINLEPSMVKHEWVNGTDKFFNGQYVVKNKPTLNQEAKKKTKSTGDFREVQDSADSDSSYSNDELLQAIPSSNDKNVMPEAECLEACLKQIASSEAKLEDMSRRLDHVVMLLEARRCNGSDSGIFDHTEPKTVYTPTSMERNLNSPTSNRATDVELCDLKELIQASINASLRTESVWTGARIDEIRDTVVTLNQHLLQTQQDSVAAILSKFEDLDLQRQRAQHHSTAIEEKLENVEQRFERLDARTEGLGNTFREEIEFTRESINAHVNAMVDRLSQGIASHADTMQNKLLEMDARTASSLDDIGENLEGSKAAAKQDLRALYRELETKLHSSSEDICREITNELNTSRGTTSRDLEGLQDQLETRSWDSLCVIAGRLDKAKLELFSMVEKESQLLRDFIMHPTRDSRGQNQRREFVCDFYVDNFLHRMKAAKRGKFDRPLEAKSGFIPALDTSVYSFPWYIPQADTSFQGHVEFTQWGYMKISLLFGRVPYKLGLVPRNGRNMSCGVSITNLSESTEDIAFDTISLNALSETNIKSNHRSGVILAGVACDEVVARGLHTSFADESILLRYSIYVP